MASTVKVWVILSSKPWEEECSEKCTADELCTRLCEEYNISPVTRTLFALRIKGTNFYLKDNSCVVTGSKEYELRIRYKIPNPQSLLKNYVVDLQTTFEYYYKQATSDVNEGKVPEIQYPENRKELLGLGITDMIRAIFEECLTPNDVLRNWKKYIPKIICKKHGRYAKQYASENLYNLTGSKEEKNMAEFVKVRYLQQLYILARNYLCEEYRDAYMLVDKEKIPVYIQVAPFHKEQPGLRIYNTVTGEWVHKCTIDDIVYVTRNGDNRVEVSRRGRPLFLKFKDDLQLSSFISVCDGYYRLMVKWTFNLSHDDFTPSLQELHASRCHGPVGGAFSYRKLEEKRNKAHGCFILRQCEEKYNVYYVDVCNAKRTPTTYKIDYKSTKESSCYEFNGETYATLHDLIQKYKDPDNAIYLNECIPPSEYDKSQLLLCGEPVKTSVRINQAELQSILQENKSPRCLSTKDIQLFIGTERSGDGGLTVTHKGFWSLTNTKKLDIAFKTLHRNNHAEHFQAFIEVAGAWSRVSSAAVVRLYGITLTSPTAMVMEYLAYGPFDAYLREHAPPHDKSHYVIESIELKKVAASLARALWDLSEAGIVHGHIRCRRLLLASKTDNKLVVKLCGPSLHQYTEADIHWIPVELYHEMSLASKSPDADVWAFATTLWEIFSYGQSPASTKLTAKDYLSGARLPRETTAGAGAGAGSGAGGVMPEALWRLASRCWAAAAAGPRARPQELMRDTNRVLHDEYVPLPAYEEVIPSPSMEGPAVPIDAVSVSGVLFPNTLSSMQQPMLPLRWDSSRCSYDRSHDMKMVINVGDHEFTMTQEIGSGTYGVVYKAEMNKENENYQKTVAIKRINTKNATNDIYTDFKNELKIMSSLQHENIVEILSYADTQATGYVIIMEYLEFGSLKGYLSSHADISYFNLNNLLKYCLDIANGMAYISKRGIVHRDLAARNILVMNKHHVKISDFGLARVLRSNEESYSIRTVERALPMGWYAPESASGQYVFTKKSDVWSYGVTVWEIFTYGREEVPDYKTTQLPTDRASCFHKPEGCPSVIYQNLMRICWYVEPKRRPSFETLKKNVEHHLFG